MAAQVHSAQSQPKWDSRVSHVYTSERSIQYSQVLPMQVEAHASAGGGGENAGGG